MPVRRAYLQKQGREWVAKQRGHVAFKYTPDSSTGSFGIPHVPDSLVRVLGVDLFNTVQGVALDCETVTTFEPMTGLQSLESLAILIDMSEEIDFSPLMKIPNLREVYFSEWSGLTYDQLNEVQSILPHVKIESDLPDLSDL